MVVALMTVIETGEGGWEVLSNCGNIVPKTAMTVYVR